MNYIKAYTSMMHIWEAKGETEFDEVVLHPEIEKQLTKHIHNGKLLGVPVTVKPAADLIKIKVDGVYMDPESSYLENPDKASTEHKMLVSQEIIEKRKH